MTDLNVASLEAALTTLGRLLLDKNFISLDVLTKFASNFTQQLTKDLRANIIWI